MIVFYHKFGGSGKSYNAWSQKIELIYWKRKYWANLYIGEFVRINLKKKFKKIENN